MQEFGEGKASGSDWNNPMTRRLFLKKTGGASAATFVAWNMANNLAKAEDPVLPGIPVQITITIPAGQSLPVSALPDGNFGSATKEGWRTINATDRVHSGDTISQWVATVQGAYYSEVEGNVMGPVTIVYTRTVSHNH